LAAAIILGEWRFPEVMIAAIRDHYLLEENASPLAQLLNVAAGEAERAGHGLPGESAYWDVTPEKLAAAGIGQAELAAGIGRARTAFEALRNVVG
jgi:HD-like signal output (HDOD) protein